MEYFKHECGIALIRLLKPIEYYIEKYGTWKYGLDKLYLLLEKQHNRGQEGAGIGCINVSVKPGVEYIFRERATGSNAIKKIFYNVYKSIDKISTNSFYNEVPFCGELYIGHLRYSTTGRYGISYIHPFLRRNNLRSRSLMLCGNFNLTNVDELFEDLVSTGQHPRFYSDTLIMLEMIGSHLDYEVQVLYEYFKFEKDINKKIADNINLGNVLRNSVKKWDGGYIVCGATGNVDAFLLRDPHGIRSAFYYKNEEIVVVASERPVIQTVMNVKAENIKEILPGQALIIRRDCKIYLEQIQRTSNILPCSFERIYFSRGSDKDIYQERKTLGRLLLTPILKAIDNDLENTVFSFIPNTAEIAFYGMMESFDTYLNKKKKQLIKNTNNITDEDLDKILSLKVRQEKVAIKDIKLRTFITEGNSRDSLAAHIYDITYGSIRPKQDNLVIIDDSIVRGTTLKQSIIKILDRLEPKKIVIVSSSPQVRYPDCYGIDMSQMDEFVAFRAAISLLRERGMQNIIDETYRKCKEQLSISDKQVVNYVKNIYYPFNYEDLTSKIAKILKPKNINTDVIIVYQTLDGLHQACPNHKGDWYFSGDYPTYGGSMFVIRSFVNYYERNK
ncbi:MAG: amidophosphoribosyltransferase [Bacteroidales bacterium OttesenSCG-928-I14]|jgi:amidophosphoribosyltransferase|nr:amidophosphoribosyltransferase [Bacteroidales bacterium OttesenSCG-928-I14]